MDASKICLYRGGKTMYPPVDYPLKASKKESVDAAEITYAALLDRYDSEQPITNDMIQQACQKMDEAQQFPFAAVATDSDGFPANLGNASTTVPSTPTLMPAPISTASNALLGRLKNIIS